MGPNDRHAWALTDDTIVRTDDAPRCVYCNHWRWHNTLPCEHCTRGRLRRTVVAVLVVLCVVALAAVGAVVVEFVEIPPPRLVDVSRW